MFPRHLPDRLQESRQSWRVAGIWALFVAWMIGILILSSISLPKIESPYRLVPIDKVAHFSAFAVGATLLSTALRTSFSLRRWSGIFLTITAISFFGFIDEMVQLHTPQRQGGDIHDWLADTAGATFGALGCTWIYAVRRRSRSSPAPVPTSSGN